MSTIVSLDLDDPACYHAIWGLEPPPPEQDRLALEVWLPRFLDVFEQTKVRATIFVIGRDLQRDLAAGGRGAAVLERALAEGHELGNHSFAHAYDLTAQPAADIAHDLRRCDTLLRELGVEPLGFRAPGYTHDRTLLMQVAGLDYAYDSSVLPSPTYYLAKLGLLGIARLRGRKSASQLGGGRSFFGPSLVHYLPELGLWEVPISVSGLLRLPMIGTFLLPDAPPMMTKLQGDALRREAAEARHLHIELHAIDLADPEVDGLDAKMVARQRELGTPLQARMQRLVKLFEARDGGVPIARAMGRHLG